MNFELIETPEDAIDYYMGKLEPTLYPFYEPNLNDHDNLMRLVKTIKDKGADCSEEYVKNVLTLRIGFLYGAVVGLQALHGRINSPGRHTHLENCHRELGDIYRKLPE